MKKVRCPKCNTYTLFDETRYEPGQRLVFVCSECNKQFAIKIPAPSNPQTPSNSPLKGEKAGERPAKEASPLRGGLEGLSNTIVQVRLGEWNEAGDALTGTASPDPSNGEEKGG